MERGSIQRVAIVGDGPAGAVLGAFLAQRGVRAVLFSRGTRLPLLVGESLVPAVIPYLRALGVEDEVASYSVLKPGASFLLDGWDQRWQFDFSTIQGRLPGYAYNCPRDRFDDTLLERCEAAGTPIIRHAATLSRELGSERVRLDDASQRDAVEVLGGEPDLIVDATGRARVIARLIDLPTVTGDRRDTSLFAHMTGVALHAEGHVHTDRLAHGWAWRIPLPHAVSVGIVVPSEVLATLGSTNEERFDAYLAHDPWLREVTAGAERTTKVLKFDSYQLVTQRAFGPNWALVGDALGFIDPVFSSGTYLAMDGADALAKAIVDGRHAAFARYERHAIDHLEAWRRVVGYFYDGRLFNLLQVGEKRQATAIGRVIGPHIARHIPRVFTGEAGIGAYSRKLLDWMVAVGDVDGDAGAFAVR